MLISTKGRYALRVLVDLAEHQSENWSPLKEIAARQNISEKYMEIIIKALVQNKIVIGLRGKDGGYKLNRSADQITIGAILNITEGGLAPVACLKENAISCQRKDQCRTLPMWEKLDDLIETFFEGITLKDLMQEESSID